MKSGTVCGTRWRTTTRTRPESGNRSHSKRSSRPSRTWSSGKQENIRLGTVTFEDEDMADETWEEEEDAPTFQSLWQMAEVYRGAKETLYDADSPWSEMEKAVHVLEQLWDVGFTVAAHQLGKCWRDGLGVMPDDEKAEAWFRKSAEAGNDFSQYALGKLLQQEKRIHEAVEWYEKASAQRNQYADYRLGKLYLQGEEVPKDVPKAIGYLTASAESGNQYAQYTLGKLYLMGQEVSQDREAAWYWFTQSADQGNQYAQFFLDHFQQIGRPSVFLAATKLLTIWPRPSGKTSFHPRPRSVWSR